MVEVMQFNNMHNFIQRHIEILFCGQPPRDLLSSCVAFSDVIFCDSSHFIQISISQSFQNSIQFSSTGVMFQSRNFTSRIAAGQPNNDFVWMWYWVSKHVGNLPKDVVKLLGEYCVVRKRRADIFLEGASTFVHAIWFQSKAEHLGDMISIACDPICLTQTRGELSAGTTEIRVVSTDNFRVGMKVQLEDYTSFLAKVVSKTEDTVVLDKPLPFSTGKRLHVLCVLDFVRDLVVTREGEHELLILKELPTSLVMMYTNNSNKMKELKYTMEVTLPW